MKVSRCYALSHVRPVFISPIEQPALFAPLDPFGVILKGKPEGGGILRSLFFEDIWCLFRGYPFQFKLETNRKPRHIRFISWTSAGFRKPPTGPVEAELRALAASQGLEKRVESAKVQNKARLLETSPPKSDSGSELTDSVARSFCRVFAIVSEPFELCELGFC